MKSKKYYSEQYEVTPQLGGGRIKYEVTYKGDYFRYGVPDKKLLNIRILFLAVTLACAALFVVAGLLDTVGTRRLWVALPYVGMFLPVAWMLYACIKQFFAKRDMTEKEHDSVVGDLKKATLGLVITSGLTFAGTAVFLLTEKVPDPSKEWMFLGMVFFLFIISFGLWKYQRSIPVITINQQQYKKD
ncbi:MAG: hypothetical protein ACOYIR_00525 [Christensenellales bacterium]|jgi:hypothetical protein